MPQYETPQTVDTANLIDTRPKSVSEQAVTFGQRYLTSLTAVAEVSLGDPTKWREVLAANPSMLPFKLPPTLQTDIDNINNTIAFTGLKVPSLEILETDLKKALGDLANPVLSEVDGVIKGVVNDTKDLLKMIDWLV